MQKHDKYVSWERTQKLKILMEKIETSIWSEKKKQLRRPVERSKKKVRDWYSEVGERMLVKLKI